MRELRKWENGQIQLGGSIFEKKVNHRTWTGFGKFRHSLLSRPK